jgi:hypothetical protein
VFQKRKGNAVGLLHHFLVHATSDALWTGICVQAPAHNAVLVNAPVTLLIVFVVDKMPTLILSMLTCGPWQEKPFCVIHLCRVDRIAALGLILD